MSDDVAGKTGVVRTLPVDIIDKSGKKHTQVLRATIIEPREGIRKRAAGEPVKKGHDGTPDVPAGAAGLGHASSEEDDLFHSLIEGTAVVIDPPYDMKWLALAMDNSNELGQNIRTLVTNTVKFGHRLKESKLLKEEKIRAKLTKVIDAEKARLSARRNLPVSTKRLK